MDVAREISQGEKVEGEIDAFISRRHEKRVRDEGERDAEAAWAESVRRHEERQRELHRAAWCEHFEKMRTVHGALADEYAEKLRKLTEGHAA